MALWNESAVAVERRDGKVAIIGEGTLAALVNALQALTPTRLSRVRVSLPDRHAPPHTFEGQGLAELVKDPRRPIVRPTPLLAFVVE